MIRTKSCVFGCLLMQAAIGFAQSKYAPAFEHFQASNDQEGLKKEIFSLNIAELDPRIEVPVLVDVVSRGPDEFERESAAGLVGLLAAVGQLNGVPGEVFLPATAAFRLRFSASQGEEKRTWGRLIILLNAGFGFQPDPEILALTYDLTSDKDIGTQGLAFKALARLRPLTAQAKELFRSRVIQRAHQVSGADLLPTLVHALPDPDVVQIFVAAAESKDLQQQRIATQVLSGMNPLPQYAVDLFLRLQQRQDLDPEVAANVKAAIERI